MSELPDENGIKEELEGRFASLRGAVRVARARRLFAEVPADDLPGVFEYLVHKMDFSFLSTITGLDLGERLGVIYHLARGAGIVLNLSTSVPKDAPVIRSVMAWFPAAEAYEREISDLLGFQVEGLPAGRHYPLPDDWPAGEYPLRKDWNPAVLDKKSEDKHG